ncbi:MAG: bifunctional precorrin-2 dehydrogenase/sirohydrochlorin ferrochelatase [Candidatus Omnitrophica bacterium]|nr:bifunctional precorrin-2 dehydrogenase/sirohydrochlorin ferrochelatase [Candidatus Omnitrophota bacterium]
MGRHAYYPMFVDLNGRSCLVIGGGLIAQRKVTTLLRYGARVTVISPTVTRRLARYAAQRKIGYLSRRFRPSDLGGAWLVYAATDDQRINELVFRTATKARIFTNVVDRKPLCSFIAPAIVKRGELVIAVSTGGGSPALAKQVRRDLTGVVGVPYARMLSLLKSLRGRVRRQLPSVETRKRYFERLVAGRTFALVRSGRSDAARREALQLLRHLSARNGHR